MMIGVAVAMLVRPRAQAVVDRARKVSIRL